MRHFNIQRSVIVVYRARLDRSKRTMVGGKAGTSDDGSLLRLVGFVATKKKLRSRLVELSKNIIRTWVSTASPAMWRFESLGFQWGDSNVRGRSLVEATANMTEPMR